MKFASLAAVLAVSGLIVAGCGGGGDGSATASSNSGRDAQVKFSQCMRENGITDFPDPDSQGRLTIKAGPGSNINPNNPQFKAAQKACAKYQPKAPSNFDRANAQKMQAAALKYAQCMRAQGINFPDPKFLEGGAKMTFGGPGINPNDPKFKAASQACSKLLPGSKGGPGGFVTGGPEGSGK